MPFATPSCPAGPPLSVPREGRGAYHEAHIRLLHPDAQTEMNHLAKTNLSKDMSQTEKLELVRESYNA
jgi:hypothetical protein